LLGGVAAAREALLVELVPESAARETGIKTWLSADEPPGESLGDVDADHTPKDTVNNATTRTAVQALQRPFFMTVDTRTRPKGFMGGAGTSWKPDSSE